MYAKHHSQRFQDQFSVADIGRLYRLPNEAVTSLGFQRLLPSNLIKQYDTLGELVTMIREPLIEVSTCMAAVRNSFPALRLVLWGSFGTGKSVTLNQAVHLAYAKNMVIVHLYSAMNLTRRVKEVEMSTFKQGRINDPVNAVEVLQRFKEQNQHVWKTLSGLKIESTGNRHPPFLATDCVGALFRELKRHSSADSIKLFVAVDDANSLWGKTLVKKADRSYVSAWSQYRVVHMKCYNGCILLVADKKEVADARDELTVPRHTPLELFGEEGFHFIEPFVPVEVKLYSKEEVANMYQYYHDKRWLASEKGKLRLRPETSTFLNAYNNNRATTFNIFDRITR
ncbi:unnamed protein product [Heligmosomoides polygyrus]|uniref:Small ribosomal subunit protein mS29 n=1 Tax=Heligmosomoides polygyrus TaxID=6339 RepID=A0A3P8CAH2_HELPZ|nr:unnamed protein product [Heligmosomoides polygyrus]